MCIRVDIRGDSFFKFTKSFKEEGLCNSQHVTFSVLEASFADTAAP